jgi:hypothetical protein
VAPATQIPQVAPTPLDNVVTLVWVAKSMRELGCDSFSGEPDVEIAGRWLRTVENIMEQIQVTEDLLVNCATHLLSDRARSCGIQCDLGGLRGLGHGLNLEFNLRTSFTHHIIGR